MYKPIKILSAYDILKQIENEKCTFITTLSNGFDEILGGYNKLILYCYNYSKI